MITLFVPRSGFELVFSYMKRLAYSSLVRQAQVVGRANRCDSTKIELAPELKPKTKLFEHRLRLCLAL